MSATGDGGDGVFAACIAAAIREDEEQCAARGWPFQPRPAGQHTIGDLIRAVLAIDDAGRMRDFHAGYVAWLAGQAGCADPAAVARANIGWCFGEGMAPARIALWSAVCAAEHPVFGAAPPASPGEVFLAGVSWANRSRQADAGTRG